METPGFFARLLLAFSAFFRLLLDGAYAGRVIAVRDRLPEPPPPPPAPKLEAPKPVEPPRPAAPDHSAALHLLAILQREGRFVDFLQEDIATFPDADVGAAARLVHEGCRKALREYVVLEPLRAEGEGASVVVAKGFDAGAIRLTGNVTGEPPFTGALRHHGWRAADVKLPPLAKGTDATIIAPAEVEL